MLRSPEAILARTACAQERQERLEYVSDLLMSLIKMIETLGATNKAGPPFSALLTMLELAECEARKQAERAARG